MTDMPVICSVYRSPKKDDTYVYVDKRQGLEQVPKALLNMLGSVQHSMDIMLTPDKKLARAIATEVLTALEKEGFYLQMPANKENYLLTLSPDNS